MYQSIDAFIRENDKEETVRKAIAKCLSENMTKDVALDVLAQDLQKRLYSFIYKSDDLDIDSGSNIERDFTKVIKEVLSEYFKEVDFYRKVASRVYDKEIEDVTDNERFLVKNSICLLAYHRDYSNMSESEYEDEVVSIAKAVLHV